MPGEALIVEEEGRKPTFERSECHAERFTGAQVKALARGVSKVIEVPLQRNGVCTENDNVVGMSHMRDCHSVQGNVTLSGGV